MPYTIEQLKEMFQAEVAPGDNTAFLKLAQEAEVRLLEAGKWMWCRRRADLTPVNGIITLDPEYASIIGAQLDSYPTPIHAMDFEFSPDGPGEIEVLGGGSLKLIDQGLTDDLERQYKVTGCDSDDLEIVALCHLAPKTLYDPDIADSDVPVDATDVVTCPDAGAMKLCMLAIIFENEHDLGASKGYMGTAYARLNEREKTRRGNAQQVPNVRPQGRGVSRIRNIR